MRSRLSTLPLFWRIFAVNAIVLVLAFAGLALAPVTVSAPVAASELAVLAAGLVCLLAVDLMLLRHALSPLDALADTMRRHDPLAPGARADVPGDPDLASLANAFNDMLDRLESERRESARQALMLQEAERLRIARELHDEVGQTLTGVMLQVEGLAGAIPEELRDQLDVLRETARHGTEEVRRIARRLRPEALEELGLHSAMAALATGFEQQARIRIDRRIETGPRLSREQELVVYRVAQEALTNVARHAEATRVDLGLQCDHGRTILTVRDNGRGMSPESLRSSNGIRGMRERAMLIGANLTIQSRPGQGTQVRLTVPPTPRADDSAEDQNPDR
jgi:two-component system sensor histidine kinase UhpB